MITKDSPEITSIREISRAALVRTAIRFNITRDMEEASQVLGLALYKSWIRTHPLALKPLCARWGEEALRRALAYLEEHGGIPTVPLKVPRTNLTDQRKTPPEIRVLWPICDAAVGEVLMGLGDQSRKALTLHLSWALHNAAYVGNSWYRDEVDELRRIRRKERYSSGAASLALMLAPVSWLMALG